MNTEKLIKKARDKMNDMMMGMNNVDKLMTDFVNPFILMEEQPMPIQVGEHIIFVGNLTLESMNIFWERYVRILVNLSKQIVTTELSEDRRKELLEKGNFMMIASGKDLFELLNEFRWLKKDLSKLIYKTVVKQQAYYLNQQNKKREELKWKNCSFRYFWKNMTESKLIQMLFAIYLYNFNQKKKYTQAYSGKNGHTRETDFADLYRFLLSELGWSHGEIFTCPYAKILALVETQNG